MSFRTHALSLGLGAGQIFLGALGARGDVPWAGPRPVCPPLDEQPACAQQLGPVALKPVATFYLVNGDKPTLVRARVSELPKRTTNNRAMLRAFDSEERLTHWQYTQTNLDEVISHPADPYAAKLVPMEVAWKGRGTPQLLDSQFVLVEPGVHQVRCGVDKFNANLEFGLSRSCEWGISMQNGDWSIGPQFPKTMYAYVPPRATALHLRLLHGAVRIADEDGKVLLEAAGKESKVRELPVAKTDCIWRFDFSGATYTGMKAYGFPLILCSSEEAARRIRASVEVLPDGTVVAHKFQRHIAETLPSLLAPEMVGVADELIVPLKEREEAWLADPRRNQILCGSYAFIGGVAHALREQNMDPESRWSGLFTGYEPPEGVSPEDHRWDTYLPVRGMGGSRAVEAGAYGLAMAATLDVPLNPYHGRRELLVRAAVSSLRDLMLLNEAEVWPGAASHWYPSSMSFVMGNKNLPPFGMAAPLLPPEIRDIWFEGVRRMVDRAFPDHLVSARNQSSHCLVAFARMGQGAQDPVYQRLARLYAAHFAAGARPPGYQIEACGPDTSYIGMTHWYMGRYYRLTEDEDFLKAIAKSYRFFNHTVAPEPDGRTILGGFNFNHRVGMGFFEEQYGGSKGMLDDVIPEVGCWKVPEPEGAELDEQRARALRAIRKELDHPRDAFPGRLSNPRYEFYTETPLRKPWPAEEAESFIRNFSDELIAVRRPGYYLAVYVGKPAGGFYIRGREKLRAPFPKDAESNGGKADVRSVTPFLGGGLSMFWTPAYGTALLATNWTPLAHHGLVGTMPDGKRYWEDYHATSFELDVEAGTLVVRGRLEGAAVDYERRYIFEDQQLKVELSLTARKEAALTRLVENIPLVAGKLKKRGARIVAPATDEEGGSHIQVRDQNGKGVDIRLATPHALRVCRNGMLGAYNRFQVNRAEIALPSTPAPGETIRLSYFVSPAADQQ